MPSLGCWALLFLLLLLPATAPAFGFFSWLTRPATPAPAPPEPTAAPGPGNHPPVPFEMTTADEKFLAEAQRLHLSPLDSCHHQVMAQLRSSCTDLTEEELAKLGVSLFNCQASVEGRKTYLCTADMNGQEELKALTSESLEKVVSGQQDLLAQQERFQDSQEQMGESIQGNLAQLAQEKALIASGQQRVAQLIEGIVERMENVSGHLDSQDTDLQEGHKTILKDLAEVHVSAQGVYAKIETSLGSFLAYQNQTTQYYDELMKNLQKLNESLGLVLSTMDRMQSKVEARLQHIQRFISWAGFSLSAVYTCVLHGSYFLLAALLMTFLQVPGFPRALLLVLVVANALLELHQAVSLGFNSLTSLLVFSVAGNWLLKRLFQSALRRSDGAPIRPYLPCPQKTPEVHSHKVELTRAKRCRVTSTPEREGEVDLLKEERDSLGEVSYMPEGSQLAKEAPKKEDDLSPSSQGRMMESNMLFSPGWKPQEGHAVHKMSLRRISLTRSTKPEVPGRERFPGHRGFSPFPDSRASTPNESMVSDMSTCSASARPPCQAVTRTGQPCRKKALPGHAYCHVHDSGQTSYIS
ncbi:hypothetical protein JRQ81_010907 [Phrynocephalus forsythii]|uniref:Protein brambleberry n=1 Tax=Phrynocephalus forsythii TaxID=171643 RepID=A0A9Q1B4Z8_9SAUR|nr:hypothetical protein JRQ81_010907 [Phrynocephalus forsythii]